MFDRTKDWQDIDAIAHAGTTDLAEALRWLTELLGSDAPQVAHLQDVAGQINQPQGPAAAAAADEAQTRTRVNAVFQRPTVSDTTLPNTMPLSYRPSASGADPTLRR
ncbi:MAG: hypothetical protein ACSLFB_09715 [Acidimicrobiales bacterium]